MIPLSLSLPRSLFRIAHGMATKEIRRMFDFRHWRTQRDIELHQRWQDGPRQSILIVGDGMFALHLGGVSKMVDTVFIMLRRTQ